MEGEVVQRRNLSISILQEVSFLKNIHCGILTMDRFLRTEFADSIHNKYCLGYTVSIGEEPVGVFALAFGSLILDSESKDDMQCGFTGNKPGMNQEYLEAFYEKMHYPSLEISYVAVDSKWQRMGIGRTLVSSIEKMARDQHIAGCMFLTVDALSTRQYTAVPFYSKCGFCPSAYPNPSQDTLRMFKALYI